MQIYLFIIRIHYTLLIFLTHTNMYLLSFIIHTNIYLHNFSGPGVARAALVDHKSRGKVLQVLYYVSSTAHLFLSPSSLPTSSHSIYLLPPFPLPLPPLWNPASPYLSLRLASNPPSRLALFHHLLPSHHGICWRKLVTLRLIFMTLQVATRSGLFLIAAVSDDRGTPSSPHLEALRALSFLMLLRALSFLMLLRAHPQHM